VWLDVKISVQVVLNPMATVTTVKGMVTMVNPRATNPIIVKG
jgi:hypothetical protein